MSFDNHSLPVHPDASALSTDLQARIQDIVGSDEHLVWVGQPVAWRRWFASLATSVFSLIGFFLFLWLSGAGQMLEDLSAPFFAVFVAMVLMMMVLPSFIAFLSRWEALYLLTTKRVVVVGPKWFGLNVSRSYQPHQLHGMYCRRVFGGVGDLILERVSGSSAKSHRGFHAVRNPREVQLLIEATLLKTAATIRIACSPIASGSASFRTTEVRLPTRDTLLLAPTRGARLFGMAMIVFAMGTGGVVAALFATGEFRHIGQLNGLPAGGYAVIGMFSIFSIVLALSGLGTVFQPPVRCDQSSRRIGGGFGPTQWSHSWDDVCCLQVINGKYVQSTSSKGSSRSYQTYELNLVVADGRFTRINLTCHADRQAISEDARQVADFLGKPRLDWVNNPEAAESAVASLHT